MNNDVPEGWSIVTPCFENVGENKAYAIDNFLIEGVADCDATVQVMNSDGSWGAQGFWFNEAVFNGITYPAGWCTGRDGLTPANITLNPGDAVMLNTKNAAKIQSAGQVSAIITKDVEAGWSMIGTASPTAISIDSITLIGVADCDATVQVMNADGSWGVQGFWFNEAVFNGVTYPAGWCTGRDGLTPAAITLQPGQSVMFNTKDAAKVVLPSALK